MHGKLAAYKKVFAYQYVSASVDVDNWQGAAQFENYSQLAHCMIRGV